MSRVFAYARVSTNEQDTAHQMAEIKAAGFAIEERRAIEEQVSGSVCAMLRPGFAKLIDRMEQGDVLIVTKIDRLGRDAIDVRQTVDTLAARGIRVHCLQLGGADLTSPAGKMIMTVLSAMAEFERDLIIERTKAGQATAKAKGVAFGRKPSQARSDTDAIRADLAAGMSAVKAAEKYGTSRNTIMRIRDGL
ncbi:recombinase family protein [Paraburkholderia tropica]|uniref:recombinase family protein n=1 Tax=Paraburkholderia tropica TaxID=92647 RepID=UPI003D2CD25E